MSSENIYSGHLFTDSQAVRVTEIEIHSTVKEMRYYSNSAKTRDVPQNEIH